jgi:hypothetical protein
MVLQNNIRHYKKKCDHLPTHLTGNIQSGFLWVEAKMYLFFREKA